jgi:hypothetical protein
MKIKIVSDGTSEGTKVLDALSGEPVSGVQMINFMCGADGVPEALMHIVGIQCEIITDAAVDLAPDLNPYKVEDLPLDLKDIINVYSRN